MSQNLLMIEDDARLADMVREYLGQSGFVVTHATDGNKGLAAATLLLQVRMRASGTEARASAPRASRPCSR